LTTDVSEVHTASIITDDINQKTALNIIINQLLFQVLTVESMMMMTTFWSMALVILQMSTDVPEVHTTSIIRVLKMEAVCTSKTSVYFYKTMWCHIPEGCHL
jgi:hypothetical protein